MPTYLIATYGTFGVMGASLFGSASGLASDRGLGWLQVKRASPMPPFAYFVAKVVTSMIFSTIIVLALFTLGIAAGTTFAAASAMGLLCDGNGEGAAGTIPAALQLGPPLSVAIGFRFVANPSAAGTPLGGLYLDNGTNNRILAIESNTPATIQAGYAGTAFFSPAMAATVGVDYVVSASIANGAQAMSINGASRYAAANAIGTTWSPTSRLVIGANHPFFATRNPNVIVYWLAWWGRALAAAEHAAIGASINAIWPIMAPGPLRSPASLVAAGVYARRGLSGRAGSRGAA